MKLLILNCIIAFSVLQFSCKKKEIAADNDSNTVALETCLDQSKLKNILWKPIYNGYDNIFIGSDDTMYIGGNKAGKYIIDCNKVSITTASQPTYNNFFIIVKYVTSDTLLLNTLNLGVTKFHK